VDARNLQSLLAEVADGKCTPEEAFRRLRHLPFEDLEFARVDHHRAIRQGTAEVIFGKGKTPEQIAAITSAIAQHNPNVLITRATQAAFQAVSKLFPEAQYHTASGAITVERERRETGKGSILVVSAGTSDIPVAEEACVTARIMGSRVEQVYDIGVAGLHRVMAERERLMSARVVIVVAGMEGALPSVVAGLVAVPVIAVPTSVGYGASFEGLAALLGMLNSCAPNVTVVNIDNGFGAGFVAATINRL
jgi:NCAIR mutase (PurE)-related protein